jgi:hypothetical protein
MTSPRTAVAKRETVGRAALEMGESQVNKEAPFNVLIQKRLGKRGPLQAWHENESEMFFDFNLFSCHPFKGAMSHS